MEAPESNSNESREIAQRWCEAKGLGWLLGNPLGKGGTAPVFEVTSPHGARALKIYDRKFCTGETGELEQKRLAEQLSLMGHECPHLVDIYEGGRTEGRLFLLMGRAPGVELEKKLATFPRSQIRNVVDKVARAAIFLRDQGFCHRDIKAANIFYQ